MASSTAGKLFRGSSPTTAGSDYTVLWEVHNATGTFPDCTYADVTVYTAPELKQDGNTTGAKHEMDCIITMFDGRNGGRGVQGRFGLRTWNLPDLRACTLHVRAPESLRNTLLRRGREPLPTTRPRWRLPYGLRPDRDVRRNTGERRDNLHRYDSHLQPVHDKTIPVPALPHPLLDNLSLHGSSHNSCRNSCHCSPPRPEEAKAILAAKQ